MSENNSDEALMLAFAQNDQKAFETLYIRYKDALYRYYLRHVSSESISQELFQDLWMKVIKSKKNYKVNATFKTWLYTLAHHRLVDWYRRNTLENNSFDKNIDEIKTEAVLNWDPSNEFQTKRMCKKIKNAIGELPFKQREVFLLHQEALLSLPQIAEMMQEGVEKIKSRYRYAINKLRHKLENIK